MLLSMTWLSNNDRVVFIGDSVTDTDRDRLDPADLGFGYPLKVAQALRSAPETAAITIFNRGVSGDRLTDLAVRLKRDCLALSPTLVSVLIGINDTWRIFDSAMPSDVAEFEQRYEWVLTQLTTATSARLVLMEPFVVPFDEEQWGWRADVDARIQVVRRMARAFGAILIPSDGLMNAASCHPDPARREVTQDGVHPSDLGHQLLADAWLAGVR
jgi:lysophospholipase L1-like esterase